MNRRFRNQFLFLVALLLFQKGEVRRSSPGQAAFDDALDDEEQPRRIRCPECKWEPNPSSLWYCGECPEPEGFLGGCGTAWNTFDTAGLCPGCGHQWRWTACLRCGEWSLHEEWYAADSG